MQTVLWLGTRQKSPEAARKMIRKSYLASESLASGELSCESL